MQKLCEIFATNLKFVKAVPLYGPHTMRNNHNRLKVGREDFAYCLVATKRKDSCPRVYPNGVNTDFPRFYFTTLKKSWTLQEEQYKPPLRTKVMLKKEKNAIAWAFPLRYKILQIH